MDGHDKLPDFSHYGYEPCDECGYDHEYEPEEAAAAHAKLEKPEEDEYEPAIGRSVGPQPMQVRDIPTQVYSNLKNRR